MNRRVEYVSPLDLKPGNLVLVAGGVFRVLSGHDFLGHGSEPATSWSTEHVDLSGWSAPRWWADDWNVQGNRFARVARILE